MAGVQLTLIQSRVGRRVATLFVLCALLPLLVISGVVSWLVSGHLRSREEERLRALAKESVMASVERLLDVEGRLRVVAGQTAAVVAPDSLRGVTALVRLDSARARRPDLRSDVHTGPRRRGPRPSRRRARRHPPPGAARRPDPYGRADR